MIHKLDSDFIAICKSILEEGKTIEQWALIESDDMFEKGKYSGGFDATEKEFCFSVTEDGVEYWFQLSLDDLKNVVESIRMEVEVREADY